jgi:hypothetical protein
MLDWVRDGLILERHRSVDSIDEAAGASTRLRQHRCFK